MPSPRKSKAPSRTRREATQAADLLFEIGTEELPAAYVPGLIDQLCREAEGLLRDAHLSFQKAATYGTPRRLVLIVRGLSAMQQNPAVDIRGPSKQAAFDAQGKPTGALQGFLRSQGGTLAQTKLVASPKGEYLYFLKPAQDIPATKVLPTLLPQLVTRLKAPKTMRWDESGLRFARPIRWVVALYGRALVRCQVGRLHSAALTHVGLPRHPKTLKCASVAQYLQGLKRAGVLLDHRARREAIQAMVARAALRAKGRAAAETATHGLLDEVTYLVEQPHPLVGGFDAKYLQLPRELLLASMAKHQRVFALEAPAADQPGALLPQCVAILEGPPGKPAAVRQVIERILNARLADSLIFWQQDHARLPLEQLGAQLSGVTFHEKLGSMADKSARLVALSETLAAAWQLKGQEMQALRRAAQLAKADLVSTMVKEFPTLQGVVGKYYAKDSGESSVVAEAIEEHYLPVAERLPGSLIGSALSILDKYDSLSSYLGLGIQPSGDQDPYGLRRAAQGIVEVAWAVRRPLPLLTLFAQRATLPPYAGMAAAQSRSIQQKLQQYLLERLYTFAWTGAPTPSGDCIDAVLAGPCDDLVDAMERIVHLQRLAGHPGLLKAAKVIERTRNILKNAKVHQAHVDPARLQELPEKTLWERYQAQAGPLTQLADRKAYTEMTTAFGEAFYAPLHEFFDQVMVNVPDEGLQQNRLALMQAIHTLYTGRVADLSKLACLQQPQES
jgi:glycyl-tRNA synthetase beta chain